MLGSRFRLAIQKADLTAVRELLTAGARVNETWWLNSFPLQYAARLPDTTILRLLLAEGASVHLVDRYGRTALHEAAEYGGPQAVSVLLEHGAAPSGGGEPGVDQPLHWAAGKEAVELLLDAGAGIEARGDFGATPLMRAAHGRDPATVHTLLARGADPAATDDAGGSALHEASTAEAVAMLLDRLGPDAVDRPDESGYTPLCAAVQRGLADVAGALLARGANPAQRLQFGAEPLLHHASTHGDTATVRVLLEHGVATNRPDDRPDDRADDRGNLALHVAADAGIAELLLTAGRPDDVHARNATGQTPLHRATDAELITFLLEHGADPNAQDADGRRAVDTTQDVPGAVAALLAKGAKAPGAADAALTRVVEHAAGDRAHLPDVVALLAAGAWPDAKALRIAARRGDEALRAELVRHGAAPEAFELDPAEQAVLPQRALVVHPVMAEAVTADESVLVRWRLDVDPPRPVAVRAAGAARWEGRTVPRALCVSPEGTRLVAVAGDRLELRPWHDLDDVTVIRPRPPAQLTGAVHDGERIVVSAVRAGPLVLDRNGYQLADVGTLAERFGMDAFAGAWPGGAVLIGDRVVSLADDAGWLTLTGTDLNADGGLDLRYLHADDEVGFLRERDYCVGWLGCAPDGATVAAWTHAQGTPTNGVVVVVDPEDGSVRWTRHLSGQTGEGRAGACFSPDGQWLAVGLGAQVQWLTVADGALGAIAALPGQVCALAWDHTANGLLVATEAGLHRSPAVDHERNR